MDPCVLREHSSRWNKVHDDGVTTLSGDVGPPGSLCGILGGHALGECDGTPESEISLPEMSYWQRCVHRLLVGTARFFYCPVSGDVCDWCQAG